MRHQVFSLAAAVLCGLCGYAPLKADWADSSVCDGLATAGRAGLYVSYPNGSTLPVSAHALPFLSDMRFYFLPSTPYAIGNPKVERVWHVRTQTRADDAPGADSVMVYRPPVATACSKGTPLPAFLGDARFVSLNRYYDHHAPPGERAVVDGGLHKNFHLKVKDPEASGGCLWTDDRAAYKNLWKIYGFDGVSRGEQRVASLLSFAGPAYGATTGATEYAGLSSEFAVVEGGHPACFGFAAPQPTHHGLLNSTWRPRITKVVIKRISGRNVDLVFSQEIVWRK